MFFIQVSLVGTLTGTACDGGSNGFGGGGVLQYCTRMGCGGEGGGEGVGWFIAVRGGTGVWGGGDHVQRDGVAGG